MEPRRIVIVVADGIQALDAIGPFEVFEAAHRAGPGPGYQLVTAAPEAGPVRAESGVVLHADIALRDITSLDTMMVAGGAGIRAAAEDEEFVAQVRRLASRARRVTSVCTGAAVLAAAGVLDGRRATTHWAYCRWLADAHPAVRVEPDHIYVRDGNVWTSAGVTAGMDLALALVTDDLGPEVAHTVAGWLVMFVQRAGGQSQFSAQLQAAAPRHPSLRSLVAELPDRLAEDLSVARLAERAGMSERTFARAFRTETGVTPAAHVEALRVDGARRLLETTDLTVAAVARAVGFARPETFHRAFRRRVGTTPDRYRQHFAPDQHLTTGRTP